MNDEHPQPGLMEKIEHYILGQLPEEEQRRLEERMQSDPEFAAEVQAVRTLLQGFKGMKIDDTEAQIRSWPRPEAVGDRAKGGAGKPKARLRSLYVRAAAAALVLLLAFAGLRWYAQDEYAGSSLATTAYKTVLEEGTLGEDTPAAASFQQSFQEGQNAFRLRNFEEAVARFREGLQQLGESESALDPLVYQDYLYIGEWNMLISQLAAGNTDDDWNAKLQAIAGNPDHPYASDAARLLQKVDSWWFKTVN